MKLFAAGEYQDKLEKMKNEFKSLECGIITGPNSTFHEISVRTLIRYGWGYFRFKDPDEEVLFLMKYSK